MDPKQWMDLSDVSTARAGQPEETLTVRYRATAHFHVGGIKTVGKLCKEIELGVNLPWGFLFRQESGPNRLLMKPIAVEDKRGEALVMDEKGRRGKVNLRRVYKACHIATYPRTVAIVPIMIEDHPVHGKVLAFVFGDQSLEAVKSRKKAASEE